MPDDELTWSYQNLQLASTVLGLSGLLTLAGAALAYFTGDNAGETRTHFDAAMVLAVLGVVLLVAAVVVIVDVKERRKAARTRGGV
jgi:uncharacterized membrane protein YidH (DUF202 family)